ncbi:mechanosensitive ion channel domain-containing protein [Hyphococcus luteus]|uniref:DUF3772 domain-containing protein n=1 Tax=Hyphococcus luteus TaxID=2058213 RepID=A0A2S7K2K0_9PROT|nr:mechanosensitive ion channel domain-containing protein [Marinicaulis flavus]PQA86723.1 hypothetical protein CW354_14635 [Marinicaulis flavus]
MALTSLRRILFTLAVLLCAVPSALAQTGRTADIEKASRTIVETRAAINEGAIETPSAYEDRLRELRLKSRDRLSAIENELEGVRAQIDILGPAPGEAEPPESDLVSEQRSKLEAEQARLNGERTRVLANIYESGELLAQLSGAQVEALYKRLTKRGPTPLAPQQWALAWSSAKEVAGRIGAYFSDWGARRGEGRSFERSIALIFAALAFSLILFGPADRWILNTFSAALEKREPSASRRIVAAALKMAARTAPGVIGGVIIIETLRAQGVLTPEGEAVARAFWIGVLSCLIVSGFTAGFFALSSPKWRIAPIDAERGRAVSQIAMAIIIIFSLKILLKAIGTAAHADPALIRLVKSFAAIAIGACMILLCRGRLWRVENAGKGDGDWRILRRLSQALGAAIIAAALVGYAPLADFAATRVVFLALIIGLAWLLRAMLVEFALRARARFSSGVLDAGGTESDNYRFWSRLIINTILALMILPAVLVLFGVPAATVSDIAVQGMFGFSIGGVRIPPLAKLFSAVIVFIVVMGATKLTQSAVQRGPLAHSRADIGLQNSLITLLGYAGLVIALVTSVSALGFDLGNLALIAGALSVGIGFGLQSIVNNFVSGLILLFERPIKVGDWIVTPSGEGMVKKISVRSTEIETFDRASIIVPNSELISSTVTNWTHKDKIGRIRVPVGVSYGSNPEKVQEILLKCAREHPLVVAYPEPFVVWNDFGSSSLDFEVRAFLNDISKGLQTRTELRFAIFKAFHEEGVEIPFPQQDLYIKSMPGGEGAKLSVGTPAPEQPETVSNPEK